MDTNEMIDRYVNEVGEHLPRKSRADIEMELRSLLHDALEEQSGGESTPKMTAALLQEFGHPEEIAAKYRPEEVLIGAQLFPVYRLVVTITLVVIGALHLLAMGLGLWKTGASEIFSTMLDSIFSFGRSAILNAGIVTLIFAVIERVAGDSLEIPATESKSWDPFELPAMKNPDRIDRGELFVGIFFSLLFIGWLNFFPNWFGGVEFSGEDSGIFVLLAPQFLQHIPWLTASWLLDVVLKTAVLVQGRWNRVTRWVEVAFEGFGLYVVYRIYSSGLISPIPFFNSLARWILLVVIVIVVLSLVSKLFRLLFGRPFMSQGIFKSKLA
ncbi:MAG: hypothetical protein GY943_01495 [Chloroflexi bacterium]|nr:hypothetical protein [Chloroflexota bacterium]